MVLKCLPKSHVNKKMKLLNGSVLCEYMVRRRGNGGRRFDSSWSRREEPVQGACLAGSLVTR